MFYLTVYLIELFYFYNIISLITITMTMRTIEVKSLDDADLFFRVR